MTKVYIAGQMIVKVNGSHMNNKAAFDDAATQLQSMGYKTVTPYDASEGSDINTEIDLNRVRIAALMSCDLVALLPLHGNFSPLQLIEARVAHEVSMPIMDIQKIVDHGRVKI